MRYLYLEPEVAGGLGPHTVRDRTSTPAAVRQLHYVFDGWLGDEILESFPCFIVTQRLAEQIAAQRLSGVTFDAVEVECSDLFRELQPGEHLPPFVWMRVWGAPHHDDFFIAQDRRLAVSERAWQLLQPVASHAQVSEFSGPH